MPLDLLSVSSSASEWESSESSVCRLLCGGWFMYGCATGSNGVILASWRAMAAASSENASCSVLRTSAGVGSVVLFRIPRAVLSHPQAMQLADVFLYTV